MNTLYETFIGNTTYEFRTAPEAIAARALYDRFIGTQVEFERAMMLYDIPYAHSVDIEKPVYRADLTKNSTPFCVIANDMYEAADWVRDHIAKRGYFVTKLESNL